MNYANYTCTKVRNLMFRAVTAIGRIVIPPTILLLVFYLYVYFINFIVSALWWSGAFSHVGWLTHIFLILPLLLEFLINEYLLYGSSYVNSQKYQGRTILTWKWELYNIYVLYVVHKHHIILDSILRWVNSKNVFSICINSSLLINYINSPIIVD